MKQRGRSTFIAACYCSVSAEGKGTSTPKQDEILAQSLRVNALAGRRRGGTGVRTFKVAIWVALLAAVLTAGCSQGSRQEQGSGTTERSSAAPERQAQQE